MSTIRETSQAYPALPAGADPGEVDDWQLSDEPAYRCVWSPDFDERLWVRACAVQLLDGTLATDGTDAPSVFIGHDRYTPAATRELAGRLCAAADLADQWAGVTR